MKDSKPQEHPLSARTPDSVEWVRDFPCEVRAGQLGGKLSHFASTNAAFGEFYTRISITIHTKCKLLRNSVNGTR